MSPFRPLVSLAILVLAHATALQAQRPFPGRAWPATTPRAVGLDVAVLDSIDREIASGAYGYVDRFLVVRRGRVAYDRRYAHDYVKAYGDSARRNNALNAHDLTSPYNYFNPWWHPTYRGGTLHTLQSVTKTVTSVVIGTAVARGEFPSLDTPVLAFFDTTRVQHIDARKRRVTIRHLLTMSGGFDWNENLPYIDPANTGVAMEGSYDWVQYMIDRPMAREPGTLFNYSSGETELLAWVFRQATGIDIEEYAARHLFAPLGITDWFWKRTPKGIVDTEGGLYLDGSDLARIWWLFLAGGEWNGTRVVSADWVRASTTPHMLVAQRPNSPRYGFKWWLYPLPSDTTQFVWAGSGFGGQSPLAFPTKDMVVVFNAWNILPGMKGVPVRTMLERLEKAAR
ncbi:MAG TPA: serine hydrolase [Gemmatimonadaceae bacterium]|nr:serine hydrolase [Gemmatimonadaceae bacterium]